MDTLLPIIRRKRRPLIEVDAAPRVVAGNVATAEVVATKPAEPVVNKPVSKASDAKAAAKLDA